MDTSITFPYKSCLMRDLKHLMATAKMPTLESLIVNALTYYEIYKEYEDLKMYMVSSPFDNTDDLKAIDDSVTDEHMFAGSIDITLDSKSVSYIKTLAGDTELPDFMTKLLVIYEQIVHARAQGHGIAILDVTDTENPRLSWTNVVDEQNDHMIAAQKNIMPPPALQ